MKVALLRVMPEDHFRSIDVYADRLAGSLRRLQVDAEIIEVQPHAWSWRDLEVPTFYGRAASLRTLGLYLSRWVKYPLALRAVHADIYHILDNSYGQLAFFLDRRRTVVTSHGGTPHSWRRWNPEGPAMWMFDLAFKGTLRAARIITVSDYAKQELLQETDYPPDHVQVVHHGVDSHFVPQPAAVIAERRAELLRGPAEKLILHVGHGATRKNVATLYEAMALLIRRRLPVHLLRIGSTPTQDQARLIDELGIEKNVTHLAHVPNLELPQYYAAADLFVFPSLYEGFGIPLIEAMACSTPVVCSDTALFHEVCGSAALFADATDPVAIAEAMANVLRRPTLAAQLRQAGLRRAKRFGWERTAAETWRVYQQVLAGLPTT